MQSAYVTTVGGGLLCASSHNAAVTPDKRGVMFDSPIQGPGWNVLTVAAGGNVQFAVTVSGPGGGSGGSWTAEFSCQRADAGQVQMSQDAVAAAAAEEEEPVARSENAWSASVSDSDGNLCASSDNADVTPDQRGVSFDNPQQGPGWSGLVDAVGQGVQFNVAGDGPEGSWGGAYFCVRADDGQVQMTQDESAG